jgi:cytochrome c
MGPSLHRVVNRKGGTAQGFSYSVAMEQNEIIWDKDNLNEFIKNPMSFVVGTTMPFRGLKKEADRNAVICYLGTLK